MQRQRPPSEPEIKRMQAFTRYVVAGSLFFMVVILLGCYACMPNYPHDNPIEETIEDIIKQKYGLDLDLSPGSMET